MRAPAFDELFGLLSRIDLSTDQLARLRGWLGGILHPGECIALIEQGAASRGCPHCGGPRVHKCGRASGLQRFRCLACRRSYNGLTGTPLARLRKKECWLPYLQCMLDSRAVRAAASKTGVHRTTSFRWRHRFLCGAVRERPAQLSAIVEADETYLLESQKGSRALTRLPRRRGGVASRRGITREHDCLLVARDRGGRTLDFHTGRGPVSLKQLEACLLPVLSSDILLISDAAAVYRSLARKHGLTHESINVRSGVHARGAIHIQNVNGWHSRFKSWIRRFNGVASRYLVHYSGWQRLLDAAVLGTAADWLRVSLRRAPGGLAN